MRSGTPKIDSIAAGELDISFLGGVTEMKVKAAFLNSTNGTTHGWTEHGSWSPSTLQKLMELKVAIEDDLAAVHFDDGTIAPPATEQRGVTPPKGGLDDLDNPME